MNMLSARLDPTLLQTQNKLDPHSIIQQDRIDSNESAHRKPRSMHVQDSSLQMDTTAQHSDENSKRNLPGINCKLFSIVFTFTNSLYKCFATITY